MNRKEFLEKLEGLLSGLPESEREEALMYYNDYFDDAGPENEAAVIRKIGQSGNRVAESILYGMSVDGRDGVFTEQGYESKGSSRDRHVPGVLFMPPVTKQKDGKHRQAEGQSSYGGSDAGAGETGRKNDGRRRFKDLSTGARIDGLRCFVWLSFLLRIPLIGALGAVVLSVMATIGIFFVIWGILGLCFGIAGMAGSLPVL